jgi:ABC-type polysaccharide/polyol phosphate export permease
MLRLVYALIVGFLFVWGWEHIPNFMAYLFIGAVVLFFLKQIKD